MLGYEGNDGSLMGFLQSLPDHIPDRVFWCVYAPGAKPSDCLNRVSTEVREYVRARRGRFIPIRGFDELMAKLLSKLREKGSVPDLYERLKERARQRERNYDDQQRRLFEASAPHDESNEGRTTSDEALREAVSEIASSRKDKPWWVWYDEATAAPDAKTKEAIYRQAVEALPDSADLLRAYALFLDREGKMDSAEKFYLQALEKDPKAAITLVFYAEFLVKVGKNMDMAEEYFRRSLDVDPNDSFALTSYADFLESVRKDMDKAEEYYQRAVEADPHSEYARRWYANFLRSVRLDTKKADELERRAKSIEEG